MSFGSVFPLKTRKNTLFAQLDLDLLARAAKIFMATQEHHNDTINSLFFKPLIESYPLSDSPFDCPEISDLDFLTMGVNRCMSTAVSGHDFLQTYRKDDDNKVGVSHFFEALKSPRRLANLASVNQFLKPYLADHLPDELAAIEELKNWHLYAGDGHYHKAAIFDPKIKADQSSKEPSKSPTGHFFRLDLRTHHLGYLDLAQPKDGKKGEHDMKMLKRQGLETLRARAPKGHRVLYLWDRACIDYGFWSKAKSQKGIYFATLEKSNSVTKFIREFSIIDYDDVRNEGLISDRLVETSEGYEIRQIIYIDPSSGTEYRYLTNEKTLPSWVIVLLYKHRWDIEKTFDGTKTKLEEKRSWASSKNAKKMHANFLCLTHNLMLLLEHHLKNEEGMRDEVEDRKKVTREKTKREGTGFRKHLPTSYINGFFQRASQRTFRFIRWLRDGLQNRVSYRESLRELADVWGCSAP